MTNRNERLIFHWQIQPNIDSSHHDNHQLLSVSPGNWVCFGFCQSLVQNMECNICALQETLITQWIIHSQMYFFASAMIFVLPFQRFRPKWMIVSTTWLTKWFTELKQTQRWHNLITIRAALMSTFFIVSHISWWSHPTIHLIFSASSLLLLNFASDSQLICQCAGLPSLAAASLSPTATAIVTTLLILPALNIQNWSIQVWLWRVQCHLEVRNDISKRI